MIHEKPFGFGEMLRRTLFLSRPSFFNERDLNKEFETIHRFMEEFNGKFAVSSGIKFAFNTFGELVNTSTNPQTVDRSFQITWTGKPILYKGVQFQITAGGTSYTHSYPLPDFNILPKEVRPATYVVLKADLDLVTYATNTDLCGLTSDETPNSVPSVNVEQYKNVRIEISETLAETDIICILGTIHPKYKTNGDDDGFGFILNAFNNEVISLDNGLNNQKSDYKSNGSLFEYIVERLTNRYKNIINERQLIRRFNLSDLANFETARFNLGFSKLVNRRQLVQDENLKDLPNPAYARKHLGLGSASTKKIGDGEGDVARGDVLMIGMIIMWFGSPTQLPRGWKECDGTGGTPDLRKRFPVGYDKTDNEYFMGVTGGLGKVTLKGEESGLVGHGHTITDPGHSHSTPNKGVEKVSGSGNQNSMSRFPASEVPIPISSSTTGITVADVSSQDATKAHENRPPYLALMFLMYKGVTVPDPDAELPEQPALTYPNYSEPTTGSQGTDGGYSQYDFAVGNVDLGAGIILTNPE